MGEEVEIGEGFWSLCMLVVGIGGGGLGWERYFLCFIVRTEERVFRCLVGELRRVFFFFGLKA